MVRKIALLAAVLVSLLCGTASATPTSSAYNSLIASAGPKAYWPLDEAAGKTTAIDATGNNHSASILGPVSLGQTPGITSGTSFAFDGSGAGHLEAPDSSTSLYRSRTITYETWVKPADTNVFRTILSDEGTAAGDYGYGLHQTPTGAFWFELGDPGGGYLVKTPPNTAVAGRWLHLVATDDGATGSLYVNGKFAARSTDVIHPTPTPTILSVGRLPGGGEPYKGSIDEIAIYDRALTSAEIAQHYQTGIDPDAPTISVTHSVTRADGWNTTSPVRLSVVTADVGTGVATTSCTDNGQALAAPYDVTGDGTHAIACTVTDGAGNTASASDTVYLDATGPVLRLPLRSYLDPLSGTKTMAVDWDVSATDAVSGAVGVTCDPASGSQFAAGTTQVTCSATDGHGNTSSGSFEVTVTDESPPSVSMQIAGTKTIADSPWYTSDVLVSWLTSDAESNASTCDDFLLDFDISGLFLSCYSRSAGGPASASATVSRDATPPLLSVPTVPVVQEATGPSGASVSYSAFASDATSGLASLSCDATSGGLFGIGDTPVTCTAADTAGNASHATFTVRVTDTTAPTLTVHDVALEATGRRTTASFSPAAVDVVDGAVTPVCDHTSGDAFAAGTTIVSCTATDAAGNSSARSFTVRINDTTAPVVKTPTVPTAEATGPDGAAVSFDAATADDLVDGAVPVSCSHAPGDRFALGTTTVTCTATDAAGNTGTASFDVTVADTKPPKTTDDAPAGWQSRATTVHLSATDGGAGVGSVRYAVDGGAEQHGDAVTIPAPADGSNDGVHTIAYHAVDLAGNAEDGRTATVGIDTLAPVLSLPASVRQSAHGARSAVITYAATAADDTDVAPTVACSPASGDTFAMHDTTVTCKATDAAGNVATGSFVVTVSDDSPPVVTRIVDGAFHPDVNWYSSDVAVSWLISDPESDVTASGCGATTLVADTTGQQFACSATSEGGTTSNGPFSVRIDKTAPTVSISHHPNGDNGWDKAAPALSAAADDGAGSGVVSGPACADESGPLGPSWAPADGGHAVACSATDAVGWTGTAGENVLVDETPPAVAVGHTPDGRHGWNVSGSVPLTVIKSDATSGLFGAESCFDGDAPTGATVGGDGIHAVSCAVRDAAGNQSTATDQVKIDTAAPVVKIAHAPNGDGGWDKTTPTLTASADDGAGSGADGAPACRDRSDGGSPAPVGDNWAPADGVHTVTCGVDDVAGNHGTAIETVEVDATPPSLAVTHQADGDNGWNVTGPVTLHFTKSDATSGLAGDPSCTDGDHPIGASVSGDGVHAISCTVRDRAGNMTSATDVVRIDTAAPAVTPTHTADGAHGWNVADGVPVTATATDDGSGLVAGSIHCASPVTGEGEHDATCTSRDVAGNVGSAVEHVKIDTAPPVTTNDAPDPTSWANHDVTVTATPHDATSGVAATFVRLDDGSYDPGSSVTVPAGAGDGAHTVSYYSVDQAGNRESADTVTVQIDTTAPSTTDDAPSGWRNADTTVHLAAADAGAGIDAVRFSVDGGAARTGTDVTIAAPADHSADGVHTIAYDATDRAGNAAAERTAKVRVDTTAPVFGEVGAPRTEATGPQGAKVDFATPVDDGSGSGAGPVTCSSGGGPVHPDDVFSIGATKVTCSSTDAAGNTATTSFTLVVSDTTPPVITTPDTTTAEATGKNGATVRFTDPTATDTVDGKVTPSCSATSGDTFMVGSTTVTCKAADAAGNSSRASFAVKVVDTTAPVVTPPANVVEEATGPTGATVSYGAGSASDIVDGSLPVSCSPASGSTFALSTTTVTCTATDTAGNTGTAEAKVTVRDTTAPSLRVPAVTTAEATGGNSTAVKIAATAKDVVDGPVAVSCTPASGSTFSLGRTAISCSATDKAGNTATATGAVLVYRFATDSRGAFAISDKQAVEGASVTFWGSQWSKLNPFSSGLSAPSAFKGYLVPPSGSAAPTCGDSWSASSGASTTPPATLPAYMAVAVASKATSSGSAIGGDVKKIVIVKTDPGYANDLSHPGTGTVVGTVCG